MNKTILSLTILAALSLTSCKKDDNNTSATQTTKATITLKNGSGSAVSGITVYAYQQDTWTIMGDDPMFADGESTSDASGNAEFNNIEYTNAFTTLNKNQNNFRFSAHYAIGGVNKTKVSSITVIKGDHAKLTLTLN